MPRGPWEENSRRCIASHVRAAVLKPQTVQHDPGSTGPDHQNLWPVWAQVSAFIYTLPTLPTVHLWYSAHPYSLQEVMTCQDLGQKPECLKLFIQSNWTAQYLTFLTWCLVAELRHATPGRSEPRGACGTRSDWLFSKPLDSLNPRPPLHGLAFTNCLDCNTRRAECSKAVFWAVGTHNPTNNCNNNETCIQRYGMATSTHTSRITETNQGKYLLIYLNSQVLNLCLYIVNSTTLQRMASRRMLTNFEKC